MANYAYKCPLCGTKGFVESYSDELGEVERHFCCKHCGYFEDMCYGSLIEGVATDVADSGVWPKPKEIWDAVHEEKISTTDDDLDSIEEELDTTDGLDSISKIIANLNSKKEYMYQDEDGTHPTSIEAVVDYLVDWIANGDEENE